MWRYVWNLLRYGRWTRCTHTTPRVLDPVVIAEYLGSRTLPGARWTICSECRAVLVKAKKPLP
jgi:hypothetical protein